MTGMRGLCCCMLRCHLTARQVVSRSVFDYLAAFTMMRRSRQTETRKFCPRQWQSFPTLAPAPSRTLISRSLIRDSDTGRRSIGLACDGAARNGLDRSGGNPVGPNRVQTRPLAGLWQWTGGVRGRRRSGRRIGAGIAFRCRFACLRRGSRRWRRRFCRRFGDGRRTGQRRRMADGIADRLAARTVGRLLSHCDRTPERERNRDR